MAYLLYWLHKKKYKNTETTFLKTSIIGIPSSVTLEEPQLLPASISSTIKETQTQLSQASYIQVSPNTPPTMPSATCGSPILCSILLLLLVVPVRGWSPEFFFGDGGKNFSFGHYRMGIRGFGSAGPQVPDGCKCHKDPALLEEVVCACRGHGVKDLKANLTKGVTRL